MLHETYEICLINLERSSLGLVEQLDERLIRWEIDEGKQSKGQNEILLRTGFADWVLNDGWCET